jgi:hypothetical protein
MVYFGAALGNKLEITPSKSSACGGINLTDASGAAIALPDDVANKGCAAQLSPDGSLLFYQLGSPEAGADIRYYNIATKKDDRAVKLEPGADAIDPLRWSADGSRVAVMVMNQKNYPKRARLFAWVARDGALTDKQRIDVDSYTECSSECSLGDWGFATETKVFYTPMDDSGGGTKEVSVK